MAVIFIGHATFLLQLPGLNVLTDPVFSARIGLFGRIGPQRVRPPALSLDQLPAIDVVVLSHNHYDHLDLASLQWLARERRPRMIAPLGLAAWLGARGAANVTELDWWQSHQPVAGLAVTCTPAQHWSSRWPWDRGRTLWGGYWLRTADLTVYFCGDSGWCPHFAEIRQRLGSPDLAFLPIGAYAPRWFMQTMHMNPDEAVRAHLALGARRSLGMHFGTFQLSDEGIDEPLRDLATAREEQNVAAADFDTLDFGETRLVPEA
jgi:L-ascorbate metabolism protein UlaG (beta-lactamase superfamily)